MNFLKLHDDWKPKQKEPEPNDNPKTQNTEREKSTPLPNEKKSKLTPGEIEAIKPLRAAPNIPEDAKPPLPEGY